MNQLSSTSLKAHNYLDSGGNFIRILRTQTLLQGFPAVFLGMYWLASRLGEQFGVPLNVAAAPWYVYLVSGVLIVFSFATSIIMVRRAGIYPHLLLNICALTIGITIFHLMWLVLPAFALVGEIFRIIRFR